MEEEKIIGQWMKEREQDSGWSKENIGYWIKEREQDNGYREENRIIDKGQTI